jgi:hypothetical protein
MPLIHYLLMAAVFSVIYFASLVGLTAQ